MLLILEHFLHFHINIMKKVNLMLITLRLYSEVFDTSLILIAKVLVRRSQLFHLFLVKFFSLTNSFLLVILQTHLDLLAHFVPSMFLLVEKCFGFLQFFLKMEDLFLALLLLFLLPRYFQ
jgi:hypothetical protein